MGVSWESPCAEACAEACAKAWLNLDLLEELVLKKKKHIKYRHISKKRMDPARDKTTKITPPDHPEKKNTHTHTISP